MNPLLSILIPTLPVRKSLYESLWNELKRQSKPYREEIEIITWDEVRATIGAKRNALMGWAKGKYISFFDDDDRPFRNYVDLIMQGVYKDVDCCSLKGLITFDKANPAYFEHSIKYKEYKTNEKASYINGEIKYERYPNHISTIRASIAKQFRFPEINHGEDTDWATQIFNSGLLKTEHYINEVIYHYDYRSKK